MTKESMFLEKEQLPVFIVNLIAIAGYSALFISRQNYEFILYIFVILAVLVLVLWTNKKIGFSNKVLWGLTIWGILHMSGGGIMIGDHVLYSQMLLTLSEQYQIIKFDQFVHAFGFGVATLLSYELIKPLLKEGHNKWIRLSIVIIAAGAGLGALNEVIEFFATVITPETGVGGYVNTSLDLVSNFVGAGIAMTYIYFSENKKPLI
jgi:uncharacterized membrane protein YjdF